MTKLLVDGFSTKITRVRQELRVLVQQDHGVVVECSGFGAGMWNAV
ncbi:hypothetical protein [Streptomyces phaeochromogenes]|nr:hypothetical protein OG277_53385 [Streptomyces phaeochromogenes]